MQNLIGRFIRFIIKLVLAAFGLVFAVSLLVAALVLMVLSLLKSLVTGKKPAPFVAFSQFRQFKSRAGSAWPYASTPKPQGDVVDVEVREVKEAVAHKPLP